MCIRDRLNGADPGTPFWQRITEDPWEIDIETRPSKVKRLFMSNYIQRVLGHNYVFDGKLWRPMSGSSSGKVNVVQTGAGYAKYKRSAVSVAGSSTVVYDLGSIFDLIRFYSTSGSVTDISFSTDGVSYGDLIRVVQYQSEEFPISAQYVKVISTTGVSTLGDIIAFG